MDATAWGGWTNRSAFAVVHDGGEVLGLSWTPHFPGTDPKEADSGASWSGLIVGVDTGDGGALSGRVLITLDGFSDPKVDVSFTGVRMIASGRPVGSMMWEDLPVSQGSFSSAVPGTGLRAGSTETGIRRRGACSGTAPSPAPSARSGIEAHWV